MFTANEFYSNMTKAIATLVEEQGLQFRIKLTHGRDNGAAGFMTIFHVSYHWRSLSGCAGRYVRLVFINRDISIGWWKDEGDVFVSKEIRERFGL